MKKIILLAAAILTSACTTSTVTKVSGTIPAESAAPQVQIVAGDLDQTVDAEDGKFSIEIPADVTSVAYAVADGRQVQFISDGTKIDINYFIQEVVDPDEEEEIYEYFKNADNDNIKVAMEQLGEDDYDEMHVRLVRIKFHCDLGN